MLSVRFSREMQSSMSKSWIALVALVVALLVTGAHADACQAKSRFKAIYDFGDHAGDPPSPPG